MRNIALAVVLLLSAGCAHRIDLLGTDLLIDVSVLRTFTGFWRYTITYTPGDAAGILRRGGRASGTTELSEKEVRAWAEFAEQHLLSYKAEPSGCEDCTEVKVVVRIGNKTSVQTFADSTYPHVIEELLTRLRHRG